MKLVITLPDNPGVIHALKYLAARCEEEADYVESNPDDFPSLNAEHLAEAYELLSEAFARAANNNS